MVAQFDYLKKFYAIDSQKGQLRMCTKLTSAHISEKDFNKMKVKNATQLFSRSVYAGEYDKNSHDINQNLIL